MMSLIQYDSIRSYERGYDEISLVLIDQVESNRTCPRFWKLRQTDKYSTRD